MQSAIQFMVLHEGFTMVKASDNKRLEGKHQISV